MKKLLLILGGVILSLSASAGNSTKCLYVKAVAQPTGAGLVYLHGKKKYNESNEGEDAAERKCIWERTEDFADEAFIKAIRGENGQMPGVDCTGTLGRYEFILNNQPTAGYELVCYSDVLKTEANAIYYPSECYALIHGDGAQHVDFNYLTPESAYEDTYGVNGDNHWINGNVSDDIKPKNTPKDDSPENIYAYLTEHPDEVGDYFSAEPDRTIYAIFRPIGSGFPRFNHGAYFVNMAGWNAVKGYAWNGEGDGATPVSGAWPGDAVIDATAVPAYGSDFATWEVRFDSAPEKIIFNDDNNGSQTGDMTFIEGAYYTFDGYTGTSKLLFLDADKQFQIAEETAISGMSVCYPRQFTAGQKSTVCLPFALTAEQAAAAGKFYTLTSQDGRYVNFEEVTDGIAANTPYIFECGESTEYPFEKIDVATLPKTELQEVVLPNGTKMISTLEKTAVTSDSETTYFGYTTSGEWVKANSGTLRPFRAVIAVPTSTLPAGAKSLTATFDDATGIEAINNEELRINNSNASVYDLNGRRVSPTAKGVKIVNGKKYINK
ncbi:MAG: starch-binding protein [Prevotella sp.]|nr:starch-binding protein [Prevotella sp.]